MHEFGSLSVIPPILTIFIAFYTKNVVFALIIGILSGSLIIEAFNPFAAIINAIEDQVLTEFTNGTQSQVLITMMVIGGFVKLLDLSGGATAFARKTLEIVSTKTKAQLLAWFSGLAIFFTDSGNSLIVGPLYRSVFNEFKICREKLAYILDSTSSPVSILVPFVGWGAYIMSLIEKSYTEIGLQENEFSVLISVIPYQFYAFLTLLTVPIIILTGKDYGSMQKAQKTFKENSIQSDKSQVINNKESNISSPISMFTYPLTVMLILVISLIAWHATHGGITGAHIRSTLIIAYLAASLTSMEMMRKYFGKTYTELLTAFIEGTKSLVYVSIILVLAWSLSAVTNDLKTAEYLAALITEIINPIYYPMLVFLLGGIISLSTGSSYGTFAILMSIAIPIAFLIDASMYLTIAAVLSGGLFGDHCSPISDTTVLASMGADCPHIKHVETQLSYAILTGTITCIAYLLAGIYESPYILFGAVIILFLVINLIMRFYGIPLTKN